MTWNYRIIKATSADKATGNAYMIAEVYYDEKGAIEAYSLDFPISGDSIKELQEALATIEKDIMRSKADVLDLEDLRKLDGQ